MDAGGRAASQRECFDGCVVDSLRYGERNDDSGKSRVCCVVAPAMMVTGAVADVVRAAPFESSSAVSL